jgi:hypothetical protein
VERSGMDSGWDQGETGFHQNSTENIQVAFQDMHVQQQNVLKKLTVSSNAFIYTNRWEEFMNNYTT